MGTITINVGCISASQKGSECVCVCVCVPKAEG